MIRKLLDILAEYEILRGHFYGSYERIPEKGAWSVWYIRRKK